MDIPENLLENMEVEVLVKLMILKLDSVDNIKGTFDDIIEKYLPHDD